MIASIPQLQSALNFYLDTILSQDFVTVIKIRRLEWLGHVIRMNETRSVKKICEGKLEEEGEDDPDSGG